MLSLAEQVEPRYSAAQVEQAILELPLSHFVAALRYGVSEEHGCRIAREQMATDVRRRLAAHDQHDQSGSADRRSAKPQAGT